MNISGIPVQEVDGRDASLDALKGHTGLVYFFTTGCDNCLADMKKLRVLHQRYSNRGLRLVAIAMDPKGAAFVPTFAASMELPFPVVMATPPLRQGTTSLGLVTAVPRTMVTDQKGVVCFDRQGVIPYRELATAVEDVLQGGCQP